MLSSGYKRIAADVDGSMDIGIVDIVIIRQLILGYESGFPNGVTSWRYIPEDYPLVMPGDNLSVPDYIKYIDIPNLVRDSLAADFIATKTGDVNNTAISMAPPMPVVAEDVSFRAGELVTARLALAQPGMAQAYQLALQIDEKYLQYQGRFSNGLVKENGDFHRYAPESNIFRALWYGEGEKAPELEVRFLAKKDGQLSHALRMLNEAGANSLVYSRPTGLRDCQLSFTAVPASENRSLTVLGSQPNPFSQTTELVFESQRSQQAELVIFSIDGDQVYRESRRLPKGRYGWKLDGSQWQRSGLFYFKAVTADGTILGTLVRE